MLRDSFRYTGNLSAISSRIVETDGNTKLREGSLLQLPLLYLWLLKAA